MKFIKIAFVLFVIFLSSGYVKSLEDPLQDTNRKILSAITSGNATELSRYFNEMIDLSILGAEDNYSKTQATRVIRDFFNKYPVSGFKVTKEGASNDGSHFLIGYLKSGNRQFRVYYLLKKVGEEYLLQQFQVQE